MYYVHCVIHSVRFINQQKKPLKIDGILRASYSKTVRLTLGHHRIQKKISGCVFITSEIFLQKSRPDQ